MSKEINLPSGNYLFVEVPDNFIPNRYGALDPRNNCIWGKKERITYVVPIDEKDFSIPYDDMGTKPEIISTTKEITEEQAESIVEKKRIKESWNDTMTDVYINYESKELIGKYVKMAKESLQSLLQANSLDVNKNYLILKRL
jgi:hypothetical protein